MTLDPNREIQIISERYGRETRIAVAYFQSADNARGELPRSFLKVFRGTERSEDRSSWIWPSTKFTVSSTGWTSLPSTTEDLKNPTEDYVVNNVIDDLLITFLSINMNLIDRPIPEQVTAMTYHEHFDVINLTSLHTLPTRTFNKILLHDCWT